MSWKCKIGWHKWSSGISYGLVQCSVGNVFTTHESGGEVFVYKCERCGQESAQVKMADGSCHDVRASYIKKRFSQEQ